MTFKVGPKPVGLAARKAAAKTDALAVNNEPGIDFKKLNPKDMPDRIGIVFDDSGSMAGYAKYDISNENKPTKIQDAHAGVEEFLRSCTPARTAVAIYPMNADPIDLSCDLIELSIKVRAIEATGGTPLLGTLSDLIEDCNLTRAIVFSDGMPDNNRMDSVVEKCQSKNLKVDTVYIGNAEATEAVNFMKKLAERTGGVFLLFDPAKMNFRTAFKYLSPGYYGMLADKSFVSDLESGKKG